MRVPFEPTAKDGLPENVPGHNEGFHHDASQIRTRELPLGDTLIDFGKARGGRN